MADFTPEELTRYSRHLTLPQVGTEGQRRLKESKVLLVGAGGLGSPLGLYLAAAGVGTLGIVDFDRVDASNLHRQVLHGTADVGLYKTESARRRLQDLNPHVSVVTHQTRLDANNTLELLSGYHLVIDGTDNFTTRYLVNDACVMLGLPNVYGSIYRFQGQVSIFHPSGGGPCYRCLYQEPPPPGSVPSCAEGGVLGVLPGVIGTLQATEAIKWILDKGESLVGRLLTFDALKMRFGELKVKRNPACPVCGPEPTITELVAYQPSCRSEGPEITPRELLSRWQAGERPRLVDVREPYEWEIVNLAEYGASLLSPDGLESYLTEGPKDEEIVCYCKSGVRSRRAVERLRAAGFEKAVSLAGGVLAWAAEIDDGMRTY